MNFRNLPMRAKLMLAFALLAAVVLLVSLLALKSLGRSNDRFADYLQGVGQREHLAMDIRAAAQRRAIAARNLVLLGNSPEREAEKAVVTQAHQDVQDTITHLRQALAKAGDLGDRDRELVAEIERVEGLYGPVALDIVGKVLGGQQEAAVAKMNAECRPLLASLLKATAAFIDYEERQAEQRTAAATAGYQQDRLVMMIASGAAVLAAIAMGWLLSNAVTRPLNRAVQLARAVAAGDLRSTIEVDRQDETGQLLEALKGMNDSLSTMVSQVRDSADGIANASKEIATGNVDLSSRTEQQASALQQTAASMHQMTGTVQQAADNSRQASELARSAAEVAGRGGQVVERVVSTMGEIAESSERIADIIGVIDGIAFQTNILALNAAVEAARAGEQGRGFAVVAGEVRILAQRSAEASKEIRKLIQASTAKVQAGSALVGEAGSTMNDIVGQVRRVTDLIGEIQASAGEQSSGIGQVNQAVAAIDRGTQQNAALVEESAAATESLRQQAAALMQTIAVFKTGTAAYA
ncbi:methyl-accepting chemotaxis protein [Paucibacter sp. R3-3]|uniref:Methyl-accepting chemotaxis protein n=1 Tax=Roseateles agri TaxID=3098619 RepID=A0ABU5DKJ6_9BURK|nr:methyl-accepting chemotaxis protein [Paucibacter sp. R3-3]MDY0746825.1 methyl-accepting chemotaxis protein [Paucibacter sp. R3-3]